MTTNTLPVAAWTSNVVTGITTGIVNIKQAPVPTKSVNWQSPTDWEAVDITKPYRYSDEVMRYDEVRGFTVGISKEGFLAMLNASPKDLARAIDRIFEESMFRHLVSYGKLHSSQKSLRNGVLKLAFEPETPFTARIKRRKFSIGITGQIRSYASSPGGFRSYRSDQVVRIRSPRPTILPNLSAEENLFLTYLNSVSTLHSKLM
jgi:hypothetical protein